MYSICRYNRTIYDHSDRNADLVTPKTVRALAVARASAQDTLLRVRGLAGSAGLETQCLPHHRTRSIDLTAFAVALVVVVSSNDWRTAVGLAERLDTIVLAIAPSDEDARHALNAGAVGYLALSLPDTTLINAIRRIMSGDAGFPRSVLGQWLRESSRERTATTTPTLSARQREILERIAHGDTDKEIAHRLGIATGTVHKHVQRLLERLDVPNRAAAVTQTRRGKPTGQRSRFSAPSIARRAS